jgi:hypothetical protein
MDTNSNAGALFELAGISCCQALAEAFYSARIFGFLRIIIERTLARDLPMLTHLPTEPD